MADDSFANVDARLREAFEPDPRAAARVAGAAYASSTWSWRPRRLAAASAAAIVCLAAVLLLWPPRPVPHVEPAGAVLVGSVTDGLLVIALPDGSVAITGGEARQARPEYGYGIVLVEGELR
jgi:peptidoglycan/LPS O-acetylase OafA/YrhL